MEQEQKKTSRLKRPQKVGQYSKENYSSRRKGLLSVNYRQQALRIFRDLGESDLVKCKAAYMAARNLDTRR